MTNRGESEVGPYCVVVSLAHPGEEGSSSVDEAQMLSFCITFWVCNSCGDLIDNYDDWLINALVSDTRTSISPWVAIFYPFLIVNMNEWT